MKKIIYFLVFLIFHQFSAQCIDALAFYDVITENLQGIQQKTEFEQLPINGKDARGETLLMRAARGNSTPTILKYLLEHGAQPDLQDNDGHTALSYAFFNLNKTARNQIVKLLLDHGADPRIRPIKGFDLFSDAYSGPEFQDARDLIKAWNTGS